MIQTHCSAGFIASYLIYKNATANSSVHLLLETASKIYKTKSNQEIPDSTVIEQKKLSEDIDRKTFTYIFERLDDQGKARLLSASGDFATAWTTLLPSPSWLMKKVEFITASKFLLGMKLHSESICPECMKENLDCLGIHSTTCKNSGDRIYRHNALRNQIYTDCQNALLSPIRELAIGSGKERPGDIFVPNWSAGQGANFDVAVVSPTLHQHLPHSSKQRAFVASNYEDLKRRKYEHTCSENNTLFIPLVVEVHGCWGPSAIPALKRIAQAIASQKNIPTSVAILRLFQRLSFTLQRRNAISIISRNQALID